MKSAPLQTCSKLKITFADKRKISEIIRYLGSTKNTNGNQGNQKYWAKVDRTQTQREGSKSIEKYIVYSHTAAAAATAVARVWAAFNCACRCRGGWK